MNFKTAECRPHSMNLRAFALAILLAAITGVWTARGQAQELPTEPLTPAELEELVGPIALYPDDIIAIILPASTYPLEIVQAARFLEDRESNPALQPDPEWDDSIVALLNYPDVVQLMNDDVDWTWDLGEAVLDDEAAVLDAIQAFRDRALDAGNLYSDEHQTVTDEDGVVTIAPADPEVVYIPYYEPASVVVYQPSPVVYYYPYAYPLYYYPYPVGYRFRTGFFWGVTSAFLIGWHSHFIHVHHHTHYGHPYYSWSYYTPYYTRRNVYVTVNVNNYRDVWRPGYRRGSRPYDGYRVSRSTGGQRIYDGRRYRYADAGSAGTTTLRDRQRDRIVDGTGARGTSPGTTARRGAASLTPRGATSANRGGNGNRTTAGRSTAGRSAVSGNRGVSGTTARPQQPPRVTANNRTSVQNQRNRQQQRIGGTTTRPRPASGNAREPRMQSSGAARTIPSRSGNGTAGAGNARLAAPSTSRSAAPANRGGNSVTARPTMRSRPDRSATGSTVTARPAAPSRLGAPARSSTTIRVRPTQKAAASRPQVRTSTPAPRSSAPRSGSAAPQARASQPSRSQGSTRSARGQGASSGGRTRAAAGGRSRR